MTQQSETPRGHRFEQHAQTAIATIVVALLIWIASSAQSTSVKLATMDTRMTFFERQINTNTNSGAASTAQFNLIDKRLQAVETELVQLKEAVNRGSSK